jgi:hypothetical protein
VQRPPTWPGLVRHAPGAVVAVLLSCTAPARPRCTRRAGQAIVESTVTVGRTHRPAQEQDARATRRSISTSRANTRSLMRPTIFLPTHASSSYRWSHRSQATSRGVVTHLVAVTRSA